MKTLVNKWLKKNSLIQIIVFALSGSLLLSLSGVVIAQEVGQKQPTPDMSDKKDRFEYVLEDRSDPFVPFLTEKVPELDPNEIIDPKERLSGMQLFEPGQLNLVALMDMGGRNVAMVEDFNGKGYILEEGVKIGRRGIVSAIIANKVIIEETAKTRSGKILTNKIVMVLKKEGEE